MIFLGSAVRYFPVTAMAGQLYVSGESQSEEAMRTVTAANSTTRVADTPEQLQAVIDESRERGLPAIRVGVKEGLEGIR